MPHKLIGMATLAATAVLTLGGCGGSDQASEAPPASSVTGAPGATSTDSAPATSAAGMPSSVFGPGDYIVGRDILEGTYHTEGADRPGVDCYWQRDGDSGAPVANHLSKGQETVTITHSDSAFHTNGCKLWSRTS